MPKPDYQRIAQLERELGISQPERAVYRGPPVCLIKDCDGDDVEMRNWTGFLVRRIHQH